MGKKKTSHVAASMGQLISKAALVQMQPAINQMVNHATKQLGQQLAVRQAQTTEMMFTRIIAIEKLLIDKGVVTQEDLQIKVCDIEDERDNCVKADDLKQGDVARVSVRTKDAKSEKYESTETTKLKVQNTGSGDTLGTEVEVAMLGMKVGESREVTFADNNKLTAEITLSRVSRPIPPPVEEQPPTEETAPVASAQVEETQDASPDQVQG